ncbi:hypothetical protein [Acetobacter cibinongensis]|uniref:hypothetical protein n=1 Tax=Acetobacter cibinongensis TaxID=146475 RepID=UPI001055E312|nr:hypothetical protein [Acetobacter cibinongensis]
MKRFEMTVTECLVDCMRAGRLLGALLSERMKAKRLMRANAELEESLTRKLRENMQGQPRDMRGRYARKGAMPRA